MAHIRAYTGPLSLRRRSVGLRSPVFPAVRALSELDALFDDLFAAPAATADVAFQPRVELSESPSSLRVAAELPGIAREAIDIDVDDGVLTISGELPDRASEGSKTHTSELHRGQFRRRIVLPSPVQAGEAKASLRDGILTVELPKTPEATATKIAIGD